MAAQERGLEYADCTEKIVVACILGASNHAIYDLPRLMDAARAVLARENAALKAALAVATTKGLEVAAELAVARAKASEDMALIAQQRLRIAKLERQVYGQRSERSARLIDQLALSFEELEASATEDELAAERAVAKATTVAGFTRKRSERNTFPTIFPASAW